MPQEPADPMPEDMPEDRITALEVALAHQERLAEDLSDVVRAQGDSIDALERRLAALLARFAVLEAQAPGEAPAADVRPPHW